MTSSASFWDCFCGAVNAAAREECAECGRRRDAKRSQDSQVEKVKQSKKREMNDTEGEYLAMLKADTTIKYVKYEAVRLRIGENCHYTPDFAVWRNGLELHEVKGGHVWDDAKVKFKAAKDQYPGIRFVWAQKKDGNWVVK